MDPLIVLFDPATGSTTLGDEIILDSVMRELRSWFPSAFIARVSMHQGLREMQRKSLRRADLIVVAGSNMMNLRMWPMRGTNRWKISFEECRWLRGVSLFGVGWAGDQHRPNRFGVEFYRRVLDSSGLHAARDHQTVAITREHGFSNVEFTSCPTTWRLSGEHTAGIPVEPQRQVVTTLTDYKRDPVGDRKMLAHLLDRYPTVYLWPQSPNDARYARSLGFDRLEVLPADLAAFDELLTTESSLEFCGTRLHAGVRALQKQRRTTIIGVDNRARELAASTGLPVVSSSEIDDLPCKLASGDPLHICLRVDSIRRFRYPVWAKVGDDG